MRQRTATHRVKRTYGRQNQAGQLLRYVYIFAQNHIGNDPASVRDDVKAQRHRDGDVFAATGWDDDVAFLNEFRRLLVVKPSSNQRHRLQHPQCQTTVNDPATSRTTQRLYQPRRTLYRCIKECEQRIHLHCYIALAVEVDGQVLGNRSGFLLGQSFVQRCFVRRQAHTVFQRGVVVGQHFKDGSATLFKLTFFELFKLTSNGIGPVFGTCKHIPVTGRATFFFKLLKQFAPLAGG